MPKACSTQELADFLKAPDWKEEVPLSVVTFISRHAGEGYQEYGPLNERHYVCRQCRQRFVQRWNEGWSTFANQLLDHQKTHQTQEVR